MDYGLLDSAGELVAPPFSYRDHRTDGYRTVVERVGAGVEVLSTVDGRAVLCRQGPLLGAAFHPELSDDLRLHQLFLEG